MGMLCPRCHRTYPDNETFCGFDGSPLTSGRRIDHVKAQRTRHMGAILGGRFQIKGFVGQGGTARVYLAEDVESGEPVAVKVLEPPWAHDKVARERFLREAEAASAIQHPGIVKILFVGTRGDGTPYIVMEHLFGETLAAYIQRQTRMDVDIGLPVMHEVAIAIEAAHSVGVLHRDLKPDNVFLVGEPGEPYAVKVVDFGLARLRDSTITATGTAVGTAEFMSPEQCVADAADARTDVYGFGVVLYYAFTGAMPFRATTTEEYLAHNLLAPPVPPTLAFPGFAPEMEAVILKCLRKDPALRYPDLASVRADLEALAEGRQPTAAHDAEPPGDFYIPQSPFSKLVAKALYKRLGVPTPSFLAETTPPPEQG